MQYIEAQNRVAGKMKLKIHNKTSPKSRWREGREEQRRRKKEERENVGEEENALVLKR